MKDMDATGRLVIGGVAAVLVASASPVREALGWVLALWAAWPR